MAASSISPAVAFDKSCDSGILGGIIYVAGEAFNRLSWPNWAMRPAIDEPYKPGKGTPGPPPVRP